MSKSNNDQFFELTRLARVSYRTMVPIDFKGSDTEFFQEDLEQIIDLLMFQILIQNPPVIRIHSNGKMGFAYYEVGHLLIGFYDSNEVYTEILDYSDFEMLAASIKMTTRAIEEDSRMTSKIILDRIDMTSKRI